MKKYIHLLLLALILSLPAIAQTGLKTGDAAPMFTAKDSNGNTIDLKSALKKNKAVLLLFYRGQWCPYCNKHIQQLQDSLSLLTAKNVMVIAVTPETGEAINKTIEKTHASFAMVHDEGYKIMKDYQVNFVMDEPTVTKYKKYGIDLAANNGNSDNVLPVPATYLIDRSGKIKFVHFDKDYRKRASVKDILAML